MWAANGWYWRMRIYRHYKDFNLVGKMSMIRYLLIALLFTLSFASSSLWAGESSPLVMGETFTMESKVIGETRRINIYKTHPYGETEDTPLPVLYMPDGGMAEDFLHIAGLIQISVSNGTMRPFLLVGIENTQRRRDLTGPTEDPEDKKIAPKVGDSKVFREFIRKELMPTIKQRYRTTEETAIVGESLAGLFVVETFLLEPDMFDTYIAFDPSLWWNNRQLVKNAEKRLAQKMAAKKTLFLANSNHKEIADISKQFATMLEKAAHPNLVLHYQPMTEETHGTIYHPGAIQAFRKVFKAKPNK
jgi:uncharacterized protein